SQGPLLREPQRRRRGPLAPTCRGRPFGLAPHATGGAPGGAGTSLVQHPTRRIGGLQPRTASRFVTKVLQSALFRRHKLVSCGSVLRLCARRTESADDSRSACSSSSSWPCRRRAAQIESGSCARLAPCSQLTSGPRCCSST